MTRYDDVVGVLAALCVGVAVYYDEWMLGILIGAGTITWLYGGRR